MNANVEEIRTRLQRYGGFLKQDPSNSSLAAEVAELHMRLGEFSEAQKVLDTALEAHPREPALLSCQANLCLASNNATRALEVLEGLLAEGVDHPSIRHNLAYALLLARRPADAKAQLDVIKDRLDEVPRSLILLARTLHHLGEMDEAAKQIDAFLETNPQDAEALGVAAMIHLDSEHSVKAKEFADRALALDPNNIGALVANGSLALEEQDEATATKYFDHAIERNPASGRAWSGKGLSTMLRLDLDTAIEDLKKAVHYMPEHIGTWHALAWCQLLKDDFAGAEASFQKSMEIDRNFGETHGGLAVVYILQKRVVEAEPAIKRALRLDPGCFSGRFAQSLLASRTDPAKAQEIIRGIMKSSIVPGGAQLQESLAKAMARMQRRRR